MTELKARKGLVLANRSSSGLGLMLPIRNHYLHIVEHKPLIHYPLSILMLSGIKDIELWVEAKKKSDFDDYINSIRHVGVNLSVRTVERDVNVENVVAPEYENSKDFAVIDGDLLLIARGLQIELATCRNEIDSSTFFGMLSSSPKHHVNYELDDNLNVVGAISFPGKKIFEYVSPRLYFFSYSGLHKALEKGQIDLSRDIASILRDMVRCGVGKTIIIGRGCKWLKVSSEHDFKSATELVRALEKVLPEKLVA